MNREDIMKLEGKELNALVELKIFNNDLKPHRDTALVKIGISYASETGRTFHLRNGDILPMPGGGQLRKPEGDDDWNARYFLHVGEYLAGKYPEINAEVEAYRTEPRAFASSISAAFVVAEKINDCLHLKQHGSEGEWEASFCGLDVKGHGETAALAICRAALAVME